jgi:hypothetical protein
LNITNHSITKILHNKLIDVRREAITQVCIATAGAEQMASHNTCAYGDDPWELLPSAFPVHLFPRLKCIVIEVGKIRPVHYWRPRTKLTDSERAEVAKKILVKAVREYHKEVDIIFKDA